MDPPEHWSEVDKYGMTGWEQAHPVPLDQRLAEEQSDAPGTKQRENSDRGSSTVEEFDEHTAPENSVEYGEELGISADYAGGSIPDEIRIPPHAP